MKTKTYGIKKVKRIWIRGSNEELRSITGKSGIGIIKTQWIRWMGPKVKMKVTDCPRKY